MLSKNAIPNKNKLKLYKYVNIFIAFNLPIIDNNFANNILDKTAPIGKNTKIIPIVILLISCY